MACTDLPFSHFISKEWWRKKKSSLEKKFAMLYELNTIGGGG